MFFPVWAMTNSDLHRPVWLPKEDVRPPLAVVSVLDVAMTLTSDAENLPFLHEREGGGGTCRTEWTVSVWRGRGERSIRFLHLRLVQSSLSQTSTLQWCTKPQERKSPTCSRNLWVFRVYFSLMIDKSGPDQIPFFRKENTSKHFFPLHFSSHIEKSHRGINTSFGQDWKDIP